MLSEEDFLEEFYQKKDIHPIFRRVFGEISDETTILDILNKLMSNEDIFNNLIKINANTDYGILIIKAMSLFDGFVNIDDLTISNKDHQIIKFVTKYNSREGNKDYWKCKVCNSESINPRDPLNECQICGGGRFHNIKLENLEYIEYSRIPIPSLNFISKNKIYEYYLMYSTNICLKFIDLQHIISECIFDNPLRIEKWNRRKNFILLSRHIFFLREYNYLLLKLFSINDIIVLIGTYL